MYYDESKILLDTKLNGNSYIIDTLTGFKVEFNVIRGRAYCWQKKITKNDVERAKNDGKKIQVEDYPFLGYTCKEINQITERIETFLKVKFASENNMEIKKVLFNFI